MGEPWECHLTQSFVLTYCFLHLRNISKIRTFHSISDLKKVVNALVSSQLDYCNAIYSWLSQVSLHCLQLVYNADAAERLIFETSRTEHVTPILAALLGRSLKFWINFEILLLISKALHGLTRICCTFRGLGWWQRLTGPFPSMPPDWNSLPEDLRLCCSLTTFTSVLKTLFYLKSCLTSQATGWAPVPDF